MVTLMVMLCDFAVGGLRRIHGNRFSVMEMRFYELCCVDHRGYRSS